MRLITQVTSLDKSSMFLERFPRSGFFSFGNKSKSGGPNPPVFDLFPKLKKPLRGKRSRNIEDLSNEVNWVIRCINNEGVQTGIQDLPKRLDHYDKAQCRLHWRPVNVFCKINSILKRKHTVCRTFEMTHVIKSGKVFHEMASRNVSDTSTIAGRSVYLHKGTILKEM
jgi:hypothetical protein